MSKARCKQFLTDLRLIRMFLMVTAPMQPLPLLGSRQRISLLTLSSLAALNGAVSCAQDCLQHGKQEQETTLTSQGPNARAAMEAFFSVRVASAPTRKRMACAGGTSIGLIWTMLTLLSACFLPSCSC